MLCDQDGWTFNGWHHTGCLMPDQPYLGSDLQSRKRSDLPGGVFHSSLLSSHDSSLHPWICVWGFPCLRPVWRETSRPDLGPNIATEPVNPEQAANEQQQNEEVHSSLRKSKWQGRVQTWLVRDNSWSAKESAYALNPIYFQETRLKLKWTIIYLCDCLSCICCTGFFTLGLPLKVQQKLI